MTAWIKKTLDLMTLLKAFGFISFLGLVFNNFYSCGRAAADEHIREVAYPVAAKVVDSARVDFDLILRGLERSIPAFALAIAEIKTEDSIKGILDENRRKWIRGN